MMRRPVLATPRPWLLGTAVWLLAGAALAYFPSQPRQGSDCEAPAQHLQQQARQAFDQAQQFARQRDLQRPPANCFSNPTCAMQWNQQQQRLGQMVSQQQQRAQQLQNEANQGLFQCRQRLAAVERQRQMEQAHLLQQQQMQQQADVERRQRRVTETVTAITRLATGEMSVGEGMAQLAERQARKKLGHEGTEVVKALGAGVVTQLRDGGTRVGGDTPFVPDPVPMPAPDPVPAPPPVRTVAPPPAPAPLAATVAAVPADTLSAPAPRAVALLNEALQEVDGLGPLPEPPPPPPPAPSLPPAVVPPAVVPPAVVPPAEVPPAVVPSVVASPAATPPDSPRRAPSGGLPPVARTPAITRLVACLGQPAAVRQECLPAICREDELRFEPRCAVFR